MDNINKKILNYTTTQLIGEGGMAAVYEAVHQTFDDRKVAIKILNPILTANKNLCQRFVNEAKIMASLTHPSIVHVLDFEERDDMLAIVMELLTGNSLTQYIHQQGTLNPEQAKAIMEQVLSAFTFAHNKGVVHRDVKPANIFILEDGTPKILDFGIAKILSGEADMTTTGMQMGTLSYMSPEQIKDAKHIDLRTDIYSLGVTLYYMLSGKKAYDTTTMSDWDLRNAIVREPLPRLTNNSEFQTIIDKATEKTPEDRFQSCEEFAEALKNFEGFQNLQSLKQVVDKTLIETETFQRPQDLETSNKKDEETLIEETEDEQTLIEQADTEEQDWKTAKQKNTIEAFKEYKNKYSHGKYTQEASKAIGQLITGNKQKTHTASKKNVITEAKKGGNKKILIPIGAVAVLAIVLFLIFHPTDQKAWDKAHTIKTIDAYSKYLYDYPNGEFAEEAKMIIKESDNYAWKKAQKRNNIDAYSEYLSFIPNGKYMNQANKQITELKKMEVAKEGAFTDDRDGKVYKWVRIGSQIWMAENLAYKMDEGTWEYDYDTLNIGYFYSYETAKVACPNGWRLPNDADWTELISFLGGRTLAGKKLRSKISWKDSEGNNSTGFNAYLTGFYFDGEFKNSDYAYWWQEGGALSFLDFDETNYNVLKSGHRKKSAYCVRCIKK